MIELNAILNYIDELDLAHNIIHEYDQLRVELFTKNKKRLLNWFVVNENNKIYIGVDDTCGSIEISLTQARAYLRDKKSWSVRGF